MDNLLRTLPPEEIQFQSTHSIEAFTKLCASFPRQKVPLLLYFRNLSNNLFRSLFNHKNCSAGEQFSLSLTLEVVSFCEEFFSLFIFPIYL